MNEAPENRRASRLPVALLLSLLAYAGWSVISPTSYVNWVAETFPIWIGLVILLATYRRFRLTMVSYVIIWFFALILLTGGHYTYADVPIGNYFRDTFHLSRNHFDRFGHFFQGVMPAMIGRELILRTSTLRPGKWLFVLCVSLALAISAGYELFEWQYAALFGGERAADYLGSQGDIWDAQKDMFMALSGAIASTLLFGGLQDRQLRKIHSPPAE